MELEATKEEQPLDLCCASRLVQRADSSSSHASITRQPFTLNSLNAGPASPRRAFWSLSRKSNLPRGWLPQARVAFLSLI